MTLRLLYIDDEIERPGRDADYIKSRLELSGQLQIDLKPPPEQLPGDDLDNKDYAALLVDQDFTTATAGEQNISYYGGTLATEARMRYPGRPIILISKPDVITSRHKQIEILEKGIVDITLNKDQVIIEPEKVSQELVVLIEGYQALDAVENKHDWQAVLGLMGANESEAKLLREAASPIKGGYWSVSEVARWIRDVVMGYPGILYDELTAATRLGLSRESFQKPAVQEWFEPTRYAGIFGNYEPRWWRDRLFHRALELILEANLSAPIPEIFITAFQQRFNQQLEPAICIYDNTPIADWVCYIYQAPVKLQNSIPYYPDSRPEVMDQARVSIKAVKESNDFNIDQVDAESYELVVKPLLEQN